MVGPGGRGFGNSSEWDLLCCDLTKLQMPCFKGPCEKLLCGLASILCGLCLNAETFKYDKIFYNNQVKRSETGSKRTKPSSEDSL